MSDNDIIQSDEETDNQNLVDELDTFIIDNEELNLRDGEDPEEMTLSQADALKLYHITNELLKYLEPLVTALTEE